MHLTLITLLVRDYDEAIAFYTHALGFELVEDTDRSSEQPGKRWVRVRPPKCGADAPCLLLAKATTPQQLAAIGAQTGGRVMMFLQTDDFTRDYTAMQFRGVRFVRAPQTHGYGTVAVFEDLYGNRFDLIGP